ncbi:MAG: DUF2953 domain-containing protein [Clostridia bacterium]|nr:DUF2953 domain-containing protein [Clostridia bacterium]
MWIVCGIVAFLALLITVILMLPVSIIIKNDDDDQLILRYKFLWMIFGEDPNPDAPLTKALKKASGISQLETDRLKSSAEEVGLSTTVLQTVQIVFDLLREVVRVLKYATMKRFYIKLVCAEEDAADTAISYGKCCAVVYPLVGFVQSVMKVRKKGQHLDISCDYLGGEEQLRFDFVISVRLCHLLSALLRIVLKEAKRTADAEMESAKDVSQA